MNFLQLVQRLRLECGVSGSDPAKVTDQPAEIRRLVNWINTAWMDIQSVHEDWFFLRAPVSFNTAAGTASYGAVQAGIPLLGKYKRDSFRIYSAALGASNEAILTHFHFDNFRNLYQFGTNRTLQQRPMCYTIDAQNNFILGPIPDDIYNINGEYFKIPTEMVLETDVPALPAQFHMAIVFRAMMHYGEFEAAPEVYQHGELEFKKIMLRLNISQLPKMQFGAPLA